LDKSGHTTSVTPVSHANGGGQITDIAGYYKAEIIDHHDFNMAWLTENMEHFETMGRHPEEHGGAWSVQVRVSKI
jgi:hypothetical protein